MHKKQSKTITCALQTQNKYIIARKYSGGRNSTTNCIIFNRSIGTPDANIRRTQNGIIKRKLQPPPGSMFLIYFK